MQATQAPPEMTLALEDFRGRSAGEWAQVEADEHDGEYSGAYPFGLGTYAFTIGHALWYEDYAYKPGRRPDRGHRTKLFLEEVGLESLYGKRVLDIGCGIGQYSVLCAKLGAEVTGVELSPVGVETAREVARANGVEERCHFLQGDVTQKELPDGHFDVVLLHEVLHHAVKYPGLKALLHRVTRPGGRIVIADTVRGSWPVNLGRKLVKFCRFYGRPEERRHEEDLGDVLLGLDDYEEFARGFSAAKIQPMSFCYMVKQTALQHHLDRFSVRLLLRLAKLTDDVLLKVVPPLRRGCGEAVMTLKR